jgi:hypothetical protein
LPEIEVNPCERVLAFPDRLRNRPQIRDRAVEALDNHLKPKPGHQAPEVAVTGDDEPVFVKAASAESAGYGSTPPAPLSTGV